MHKDPARFDAIVKLIEETGFLDESALLNQSVDEIANEDHEEDQDEDDEDEDEDEDEGYAEFWCKVVQDSLSRNNPERFGINNYIGKIKKQEHRDYLLSKRCVQIAGEVQNRDGVFGLLDALVAEGLKIELVYTNLSWNTVGFYKRWEDVETTSEIEIDQMPAVELELA